jgi:hypothetical protein
VSGVRYTSGYITPWIETEQAIRVLRLNKIYFQRAVVPSPLSLTPGRRLGGCKARLTGHGQLFLQHFIRLHLPVLGCRFIDVRKDLLPGTSVGDADTGRRLGSAGVFLT